MSIDGYRILFETSVNFGTRKLCGSVDTKGDLEGQIAALEKEIEVLKAEVASLEALCVSLEYREEQKAKAYEVRDKELIELSAEKTGLEQLLAVLRASKPDKDGDKK